jgi:hypothetical protein
MHCAAHCRIQQRRRQTPVNDADWVVMKFRWFDDEDRATFAYFGDVEIHQRC